MGGFVLLHTAPGEDRSLAQAAALAAFARMGMPTPRLVRGANFVLALYPKRQASEPALQQFPNGDFVCACGTLIYEDKVGKPAAAACSQWKIHTARPGAWPLCSDPAQGRQDRDPAGRLRRLSRILR
jgi:hypothetical protein